MSYDVKMQVIAWSIAITFQLIVTIGLLVWFKRWSDKNYDALLARQQG